MQDRVRVVGFVERTPSLRFMGKQEHISDCCGEKLDDAFRRERAAGVLGRVSRRSLRHARTDERSNPIGYTLSVESPDFTIADCAHALDAALAENPHYCYCRRP